MENSQPWPPAFPLAEVKRHVVPNFYSVLHQLMPPQAPGNLLNTFINMVALALLLNNYAIQRFAGFANSKQ
jgi:hypothetical protein